MVTLFSQLQKKYLVVFPFGFEPLFGVYPIFFGVYPMDVLLLY